MVVNASMDAPVNVRQATVESIAVEVSIISGEHAGQVVSIHPLTEQCGSSFCYNGATCLIDPKSGSSTCSCHGNYTLADCSGGLTRCSARRYYLPHVLLCVEKCSEKGLICLNDATCERDDNGDHSCQCSGEWGGVDCSASQYSRLLLFS
jgi:hypothetical protein